MKLNEGIRRFYDASSAMWEAQWGEHMHHGFYGFDGKANVDHIQAQVDLVEEVLKWARVSDAQDVVDVGCGIGGSAFHLAHKFGARVDGITLSPRQCARAQERATERGVADTVRFQVADALEMPFPDASFDLVWSCESGEHMPDKARFVAECVRVLKPGGRLIIVTWCHREAPPPLTRSEERHLGRISDAYYLPRWVPASTYEALALENGLVAVSRDDWSEAVNPFWPAVIRRALSPAGFLAVLKSGPTVWYGSFALALMRRGFRRGLIKYALIQGTRPDA
jgi:tocopherol O-methyltransferase